MGESENLEGQSLVSLNELGKRAEKALGITQNQIDRERIVGKLKRDEIYLNNLNFIKMCLMWAFAAFICVFLVATFVCGLWPIEYRGSGVIALEKVFIEIAENLKSILLIALGFFFRGYLPSVNDKTDK